MPQIKKSYSEVIIPFSKMSFTPDVPSSALTANEYNAGENVETDVRGIRSVNGDTEILSSISGTPTYISGGFRQSGEWYYIVATNEGLWWMIDQTNSWTDITPVIGSGFDGSQYSQDINITEAWNGTVPIFNDTFNPPFFLPDEPGAVLTMYKNTVPHDISNIAYVNATTQQITVSTPYATAPFGAGELIVISNVNQFYNGTFEVVSSTTTTIDYLAVPGGAYSSGGQVAAQYTWNYNPNWTSLTAGFVRI